MVVGAVVVVGVVVEGVVDVVVVEPVNGVVGVVGVVGVDGVVGVVSAGVDGAVGVVVVGVVVVVVVVVVVGRQSALVSVGMSELRSLSVATLNTPPLAVAMAVAFASGRSEPIRTTKTRAPELRNV